jgi:DNA-binding NtrC family response regulator
LPAHNSGPRRSRATASEIRDAETRPALRVLSGPAEERPVLIAGGDTAAREAVRRDLARTMSPETVIEQAGAVWEVLARAADSSIVVLSGALEGLSSESLLSMLAHRHPGLPVVSVGGAGAPQRVPVAC